jgi:hypothetical protein
MSLIFAIFMPLAYLVVIFLALGAVANLLYTAVRRWLE